MEYNRARRMRVHAQTASETQNRTGPCICPTRAPSCSCPSHGKNSSARLAFAASALQRIFLFLPTSSRREWQGTGSPIYYRLGTLGPNLGRTRHSPGPAGKRHWRHRNRRKWRTWSLLRLGLDVNQQWRRRKGGGSAFISACKPYTLSALRTEHSAEMQMCFNVTGCHAKPCCEAKGAMDWRTIMYQGPYSFPLSPPPPPLTPQWNLPGASDLSFSCLTRREAK